MNCPVCGEPVQNNKSKCLRCGYEFKSLIISNYEKSEDESVHENDVDYKEIDPDNIYFGNARPQGAGSIFDELFGGSIFGSSSGGGFFGGGGGGGLFGGFSSIIDNLFGGIFGFEDEDDYEQDRLTDEFGNPLPIDVFERNEFVEVADIEEYDSEGNLKNPKNKNSKHKNFFKRKKSEPDKK